MKPSTHTSKLTKSIHNGIRTLLTTAAIVVPMWSYAQAPKLTQPAPGVGVTMKDYIDFLIQLIQAVGIPALVVAIIYSGFILITAGGNEEQIKKGKVWILWTLVGAAIIVAARVIADTIASTAEDFTP